MTNKNQTLIIAEAGVNHNGDLSKALKLVKIAAKAGADVIKFQTFNSESLVTKLAPKANYQIKETDHNESQLEMLKKLELSSSDYLAILELCKKEKIQFMSTAFDNDSLDFLIKQLDIRTLKVPSGEITNGPFLLKHALTKKNIILSTGMSSISEIEDALSVIAFGYLSKKKPTKKLIKSAYDSSEGQDILAKKIVLLHCTTQYPVPVNDINLNAITTMKEYFNLKVGFSDHSLGINTAANAVVLGAEVIEKHFTIDRELPGPDHKASLEPEEFSKMVDLVRETEISLGDGIKEPRPSEIENRLIARKSIVARNNIKKGAIINKSNIDFKRPGTGKSPMEYWDILNKKSSKDYEKDELIE